MQAQALEEGPSFGEYLADWLSHQKGRVRQKTWQGYESIIRCHALPVLGDRLLSDLHPLHFQRLYAAMLEQGSSGGSVLNLHLALTNALSQAVRWGYIAANPVAGAQPPRPRRKEWRVLDQAGTEEILLAASGTRMEAPIAIALSTGMRRGEILGLYWGDLDADLSSVQVNRTLTNTKQGIRFEAPKTRRSRRRVQLPTFLAPYLLRHKEEQDARRETLGSGWQAKDLVIDLEGRPWNPDSFTPAWAAFLKKAGIAHVRFHDLRHAHATLMLQQGVHPKIVSERLGHASIAITP